MIGGEEIFQNVSLGFDGNIDEGKGGDVGDESKREIVLMSKQVMLSYFQLRTSYLPWIS